MIPAALSLSDLSWLLGIERYKLVYMVQTGRLRCVRVTGAPGSKRLVPISEVQKTFPDMWESVVERLQTHKAS